MDSTSPETPQVNDLETKVVNSDQENGFYGLAVVDSLARNDFSTSDRPSAAHEGRRRRKNSETENTEKAAPNQNEVKKNPKDNEQIHGKRIEEKRRKMEKDHIGLGDMASLNNNGMINLENLNLVEENEEKENSAKSSHKNLKESEETSENQKTHAKAAIQSKLSQFEATDQNTIFAPIDDEERPKIPKKTEKSEELQNKNQTKAQNPKQKEENNEKIPKKDDHQNKGKESTESKEDNRKDKDNEKIIKKENSQKQTPQKEESKQKENTKTTEKEKKSNESNEEEKKSEKPKEDQQIHKEKDKREESQTRISSIVQEAVEQKAEDNKEKTNENEELLIQNNGNEGMTIFETVHDIVAPTDSDKKDNTPIKTENVKERNQENQKDDGIEDDFIDDDSKSSQQRENDDKKEDTQNNVENEKELENEDLKNTKEEETQSNKDIDDNNDFVEVRSQSSQNNASRSSFEYEKMPEDVIEEQEAAEDKIHTDFNDENDVVKIYSGNKPPKTAPLSRKVSLSKLPPLATSPETDANTEKILQRYLKYKKLPEPHQRETVIQYLQRRKINALVKNDYVTTMNTQDLITKLMQQMSEKDSKKKRKRKYQSTEEKLEQLNRSIEEVKNELKKDLKDEEYKHNDRKRQLLAQQDHEMDDFEAHWNDEDFLTMSFARPSSTLLQLKTTERQLIITKDFHRAEEIRKKCEALEKEESIAAQRNAYQEMEKAQKKIETRHRMELEVCEQHYKKNVNNLQRNHDIKMLALEARRSKLQKEIDEFKHPNALTLPKFTPTPDNVETVMTARTAQRYSTFKSAMKSPKITVKPLGKIKRHKIVPRV